MAGIDRLHATATTLLRPTACAIAVLACVVGVDDASAGAACKVHSGARAATLVELYTSEGCSSCPPADRWLSALKSRDDVVALAFHVDYWNRLGWIDRFSSARYTQRQAQQRAVNGARYAYTPQVVIDGRDRKDWPSARIAPSTSSTPSPIGIELSRDGAGAHAIVRVVGVAPARLAAYWAVTESGHRSAVKAGENQGATLEHDFVVREWQPGGAWPAPRDAAHALDFMPSGAPDAAHARRISLVVTDASTGRPLQALSLGC